MTGAGWGYDEQVFCLFIFDMTDEKDGAIFKTGREEQQNPPELNHDIKPDLLQAT